jgi:hypothetical protein
MKDGAGGSTFASACAAVLSLAACSSHFSASLRSNSSGVIKQLPFADDGCRERSYNVSRARVEIAEGQSNNIHRGVEAPKPPVNCPVAKKALGRIVGQNDTEIEVAVRAGIAASFGAEKVGPHGVIEIHQPA